MGWVGDWQSMERGRENTLVAPLVRTREREEGGRKRRERGKSLEALLPGAETERERERGRLLGGRGGTRKLRARRGKY